MVESTIHSRGLITPHSIEVLPRFPSTRAKPRTLLVAAEHRASRGIKLAKHPSGVMEHPLDGALHQLIPILETQFAANFFAVRVDRVDAQK